MLTLSIGYTLTQVTSPASAVAPAAVAIVPAEVATQEPSTTTGNFNPSATLDTRHVIAADVSTCSIIGGTWVDADKPYPWCAFN